VPCPFMAVSNAYLPPFLFLLKKERRNELD
jgi:hypothetical protein